MKDIFRESGAATAFAIRATAGEIEASPIEQDVMVLFEEMRRPLLRYLASFAFAPADAEEIVQDCFLALFQHLQRGRARHNLKGWLFRVAHNLALRRRRDDRRDRENFPPSAVPPEHIILDPGLDPEDQFATKQTQTVLLAVIDALPSQDRRCLYLRAEGLRYREIAEVLDLSISTVSVSLTRSLARICRANGMVNHA